MNYVQTVRPMKPAIDDRRVWKVWGERPYERNPTKLIEWHMQPDGSWRKTRFCRFSPFIEAYWAA